MAIYEYINIETHLFEDWRVRMRVFLTGLLLVSLSTFAASGENVESIEIVIDKIDSQKMDIDQTNEIQIYSYLASDIGSMYSAFNDETRSDDQTNKRLFSNQYNAAQGQILTVGSNKVVSAKELQAFVNNSEMKGWGFDLLLPSYLTIGAVEVDRTNPNDMIGLASFDISDLVEGRESSPEITSQEEANNKRIISFKLEDDGEASDQNGTFTAVYGRVIVTYKNQATIDSDLGLKESNMEINTSHLERKSRASSE